MSSPVHAPTETTSLLADSRPAGLSSMKSLSNFRFSRETLLIPVVFLSTLAGGITVTTFIEVIRQLICRFWHRMHGFPTTLITVGPSTPDICNAPEIARYFALALATLGAVGSIISIAGCGMFSRFSSHYGRKPAILIGLIAGMTSSCMITASQHMPYWLSDWVFLMGMLFGMFSSPLSYLTDMYIVDACAPDDRTAALSKISGWSGLAASISFTLGGSITTKTGNPLIVFHASTVLLAAAFVYVASYLPESFPEEKRNALSSMRPECSVDGVPATTRFAVLHIFEPFKMIIPTRRSDGTRNWRLAWCAAHIFVFTVASSYATDACLVLATTIYHLTPEDTGLFFTVMSVSSTIALMVIVPQLVRFLGPHYRRKILRSEEEGMLGREGRELEISDRLHVHLAVASCIISAVAVLGAGTATTQGTFIFYGIFIGLSCVRSPTIRSLVAGSVDPLQQGEALAVVEMVSSAGSFLSPIIMGSILSATIQTTPLLMFHVHLVVVLVSSALLFLIRDSDRYQKSHDS
ncbi:Major facilitator superfamily domain containing protein [Tylopilus felleus]